MKKSVLLISAMVGLSLAACKPTPRTPRAIAADQQSQASDQQAQTDAPPAPSGEQPASDTATPSPDTPQAGESAEQTPAAEPAKPNSLSYLLEVHSTRQQYNLVQPWQKGQMNNGSLMGVYLGEGRVLTFGDAVDAATYLEIALPDGSGAVPAKLLRYNRDINLALLTVAHEEDAGIFDGRTALPLGEAMHIGDQAEFCGSVQGLRAAQVPVTVEGSGTSSNGMPRLRVKAATAIPAGNNSYGLPIVRDGKLCGLTSGYDAALQVFTVINAELIERFLGNEHAQAPVLGLEFAGLDDPVFCRYLKLDENQGGLYISRVLPGSAAEKAGICAGDVLTAVEGMPIDKQGRCLSPLYDSLSATTLLRGLKPIGETLTLSIRHEGQASDKIIELNRDAEENSLYCRNLPGEQPRYIMYGGLLFQPLSPEYITELKAAAKGDLPATFLELEGRMDEFRQEGRDELVALTLVIATPATLSYEQMTFCLVEKVNGQVVKNFRQFFDLINKRTPDGLVTFEVNKAPFTIVMDQKLTRRCNKAIKAQSIPRLVVLEEGTAEKPDDADAGSSDEAPSNGSTTNEPSAPAAAPQPAPEA